MYNKGLQGAMKVSQVERLERKGREFKDVSHETKFLVNALK